MNSDNHWGGVAYADKREVCILSCLAGDLINIGDRKNDPFIFEKVYEDGVLVRSIRRSNVIRKLSYDATVELVDG